MNKAVEVLHLKAMTAERGGKLGDARAIYQQIAARFPNDKRAREGMARLSGRTAADEPPNAEIEALMALMVKNEPLRVIERAEELLAVFPRSFPLPCFIGEANVKLERFDHAVAAYERAVRANPTCGRTRGRLAHVLFKNRQLKEAVEVFGQALKLEPDNHLTLTGMGYTLVELKRYPQAEQVFRRALKVAAEHVDTQTGLAGAIMNQGRLGEAEAIYRAALALHPDDPAALNGLGATLVVKGGFAEAQRVLGAALAGKPDFPDAGFNKALAHLTLGDYAAGLPFYEERKRRTEKAGVIEFHAPEWLGAEDIAGKALYLHSEQGLGDTIQFCRYAAIVRDMGARVTLCVQGALGPLLANAIPGVEVVTAVPEARTFDFHTPLLSMPLAVGTRVDTIPAPVPYLSADPARAEKWAERLGAHGFRVGICWQGSRYGANDRRSLSLGDFAPLGDIPGVRLISLLKQEDGAERPTGLPIEQPGPQFDPPGQAFLDTAAVMYHCDLVISCDTSVAHLAGALGVPVWLALPHVAEWRWLQGREDTPWYPTMRLFRQERPGDWAQLMGRIRRELAPLAAQRMVREETRHD